MCRALVVVLAAAFQPSFFPTGDPRWRAAVRTPLGSVPDHAGFPLGPRTRRLPVEWRTVLAALSLVVAGARPLAAAALSDRIAQAEARLKELSESAELFI